MLRADEKHQLILETAHRLFRNQGVEKTSMSEITAAVGGSKATIYKHFASKEQLLVECIMAVVERYLAGVHADLRARQHEPAVALQEFGERLLHFLYSEDTMADRRLVFTEGARAGIGRQLLARMGRLQEQLVTYMADCMGAGTLRPAAADLAARQFVALLEAEVLDRYLVGAFDTEMDQATANVLTERALRTFLRAYGPGPAPAAA